MVHLCICTGEASKTSARKQINKPTNKQTEEERQKKRLSSLKKKEIHFAIRNNKREK